MGTGPAQTRDEAAQLGRADGHGYRRPLPAFSTNPPDSSANDGARQGNLGDGGLTGEMDAPVARSRLPNLEIAVRSILGFWLLYVFLITVRAVVLQYPHFWEMLARRLVVTCVGMVITFLVYLALRPVEASDLPKKSIWAGILCLPASLLFAGFNYYAFYVFRPLHSVLDDGSMHGMENMGPIEIALRSIGDTSLQWYFLFAAWAAFYGALSYSNQLRAADRRAAILEREAQDAQLRALRYQINPHFLFNTLNSLSSLVLSERNETAERMIMNLSTFFRTTMAADPTADITLEEELRLQRLYLEIEQIRFPDRLNVELDVPPDLLRARVPVLLLQPIVENAVKYGVARSRRPVTLRICAKQDGGRLHVRVEDDGESAGPAGASENVSGGVGLRNVCDRLVARYGAQAGCTHGAAADGGFRVDLFLPVVRDAA